MSRTDQEELKKIIEDSNRVYRLIAENSLDYIWILDNNGKHVYISPSIEQLRGITPEEGLNENIEDSMTKESLKKLKEAIYQREKLEKQGIKNYVNRLELQQTRKDGSLVWVESISQPIYGKKGNLIGISGITRNIEERKKAELALKESERRLSTLLSNLPGIAYICLNDKNWTMNFLSEGCLKLTEYLPEDLLYNKTLSFANLILEEDLEHTWNHIQKAISKKEPFTLQYRIRTKSGLIKWVWEQGIGIYDKDGKLEFLEGLITDITDKKNAELLLEKNEEKLRTIFNNLPGIAYEGNGKWDILFISDGCYDITEYSAKEFLDKKIITFNDLVIEEDLEAAKETIRFALEKKEPYKINYRIKTKSGLIKSVWEQGQGIYDRNGKLLSTKGFIIDITKQKESDDNLKESEEKYRNLIENSLEGLYIIKDQKIHFCNQKFADIFGYKSINEVLGIEIATLIHDNSKETVLKKVKSRLEGKTKIEHYNFYGLKKNGEIINVETLGSQITLDGEVAIQGTLRDVTKQRSSEELLRKLSQSVEQSPASIMITNLTGHIEYINPRFIELTGYSFDEVMGKTASILKSNHTSQITYKDLWKTITSGNEWNGELLNRKKSGELYWESAKIAPIKDNNGIITHFVGIKEDITEQKRIQEELIVAKEKAIEADKLKTSFLANMSHEIRTPMNAIMGFSSLLSDSSLSDEERIEFIQLINSNSNNLLNLIDDIIDIAKIEAGQLKVVNKDFNLNDTLNELLATYQEINSRQNGDKVQLKWNKDETSSISIINSDPHRIKQVLSNLIGNALKYTEEGEINFGYKILGNFNINNDHRKIQFYIKDTGIGIAEDKINVIFDRFRQADDSHTRIFGGTGLGLAISKNIAQLLGGDINAVSKSGKGSVFYFTIPLIEPIKKAETEKQKEVSIKDIDWSNKTVLIAEDVDSNFHLLKTLLKRTKINIIWVNNGEKAVKEINNNKNINLILMDMQMPVMNGFEATKIIKKDFQDIPILAVTAFALEGDRDKIIQAGCDDYISKPIKSVELIAKMNIYL